MTKPDEQIASDVISTVTNNYHCWGAWENFPEGFLHDLGQGIIEAIMAARIQEREECAKVAESESDEWVGENGSAACVYVAQAIRARK